MILIFPYSKALPNGQENPKNYPYWPELIKMLEGAGHTLVQVGVTGEKQLVSDFRKNLSIADLSELILECDNWVGIDSFPQHLAWSLNKPGIVIFSQSDPLIFGHVENINLLKDRKYLREKQFWLWSQAVYDPDAYVSSNEVFAQIR